jgi:FtsP/CotA-like multicopper oxidase with cupredoxin domain
MLLSRRALLGSAFAAIFAGPARADGFRVVTVRQTSLRLAPAPAAETIAYGFDGLVPGPLLRCKLGEALNIRIVNHTDESLSFACQGMRLDNAMDGVAGLTQPPILPGQSFDYRINPPSSGFFFYRSQVAPRGSDEVRIGLYGPIIVDEPRPPAVDRDLIVLIADWQMGARGLFQGTFAPSAGGDATQTLTSVNSNPLPMTEALAPGARIRLRLLNAASTRIMFIAFSGIKPMVLAIDSAPCADFAPLQNLLPIGPGARFDMMFDLPTVPSMQAELVLRGPGTDQPLLIFKSDGSKPLGGKAPISSLPPDPLLPVAINLKAARKLDLVIDGGAPNAAPSDPPDPFRLNGLPAEEFGQKPFFSVARGTPVTLGLVNRTAFVQQFHMHGHHLRVLHDLDDGWDPYWRDNVVVPVGRTKHVAFLADNPGKWAIECLPLYRQSSELVTWFEVR